jgi:ribosomal-protein-alanine N-acetyltransferase
MTIRPLQASDLAAVAAIQAAHAEAAQWDPADYLSRESYVAEIDNALAGFLVLLPLGKNEAEVLNIAVSPAFMRRGVGRALLALAAGRTLHLEVRASNANAFAFYRALGFIESGRRRAYYREPTEDAILMSRTISRTMPPTG